MKIRIGTRLGRRLAGAASPKIYIVDDEEAYFTPVMLGVAASAGYSRIQRYYRVTPREIDGWMKNPPDIFILDIKGISSPEVAKDGTGVAALLQRETSAYIAVTSAHQFHLKNVHRNFDFVIEERLLTAVDFVEVLDQIVADYYSRHTRLLKRVAFRLGRGLMGISALPSA